jgi:hypothetical protein
MTDTQKFDAWVNSQIRQALTEIPKEARQAMRFSREAVVTVAEMIARKKCFNKKRVLEYIDSLI